MPLTPDDLFAYFANHGLAVTTHEHEAVFTVSESTRLHDEIPGGHSKNLFLKDKKGTLVLLVAEQDTQVDMKTLHKRLGTGRFSFGNAERLMQHLGVIPGAVTPFSVLNDAAGEVRVVLDAALMAHDTVNFHPLVNTMTTSIAAKDLLRFLELSGHPAEIIDLRA